MSNDFSADEMKRYARHFSLAEVGTEGQKLLKASSVMILGLGGLGSPAAMYLAAAGVGRLGLVDFDQVDDSNLQRQILYGTKDVGRSKAQQAAARLRDLNPHVQLDIIEKKLDVHNALEILKNYDVLLDGADNFPSRYLMNDACGLLMKPLVAASILGFEGQLTVFHGPGGPCYRCLYPEPPPFGEVPSCAEGGVLGVLPGVMGSLQATEALKILLRVGSPLVGRMISYDALTMTFSDFQLQRDPDCALCGTHPTIRELKEQLQSRTPAEALVEELSPRDLEKWRYNKQKFRLIDVREPNELAVCQIIGAEAKPLNEVLAAKTLAQLGLQDSDSIVTFCKSGRRSQLAGQHLKSLGLSQIRSLQGGILAWIDQVDSTLTKY